jgi:hypothetical protein
MSTANPAATLFRPSRSHRSALFLRTRAFPHSISLFLLGLAQRYMLWGRRDVLEKSSKGGRRA